MRRVEHLEANCAVSDGVLFSPEELEALKAHAWVHGWGIPGASRSNQTRQASSWRVRPWGARQLAADSALGCDPDHLTPEVGDMGTQVYLLTGTTAGLFVYWFDRARRRWERSGPYLQPAEVCCVLADQRGALRFWAAVVAEDQGPSLCLSEDLGQSWQRIAGPEEFNTSASQPVRRLWHLAAAPPLQSELLYAGVEGAALLESRDGGRSWHEIAGLARAMREVAPDSALREGWVHSLLIDPADPRRMWAGVQVAGVFRTDDGGATWVPCTTGLPAPAAWDLGPAAGYCVHKLALDPANHNSLYLQHREGVFTSADGGRTWHRIDQGLPGRFGFPICVTKTGTVLVVPLESAERRVPLQGRLVVYASQNGGMHWQPLGDCDRPARTASVLRDALATDPLDPPGIYLGTTMGELYASADGGTTWDLLSEHLPRITAVTTGLRDGNFRQMRQLRGGRHILANGSSEPGMQTRHGSITAASAQELRDGLADAVGGLCRLFLAHAPVVIRTELKGRSIADADLGWPGQQSSGRKRLKCPEQPHR